MVAALLLNVGEPEFLLDALWITLAISAFVLGMRATVLRMAAILILIEGSASANIGLAQPVETELSDLTEWPLMIVVSTIGTRLGIFPRWLVGIGYGAALVLMLNVSYAASLTLVFPVWVAAVSVVILKADQRAGPAVDAQVRPRA